MSLRTNTGAFFFIPAFAVCGMLALPSYAATLQNSVLLSQGAAGEAGCGTAPNISYNGSDSQELSLNDGEISCTMAIEGYVNAGVVGIRGTLQQTPGPSSGHRVNAQATQRITDIQIVSDGTYTEAELDALYGSTIDVQLNAEFTGLLSAVIDTSSTFGRGANAGLSALVDLRGFLSPFTSTTDSASAYGSINMNQAGEVTGDSILSAALRPVVSIARNIPRVDVFFNLRGTAITRGYSDSTATSFFDSYNSLGFSVDGPALILPDGFTAYAPEAGIVDNRWIDPRMPVSPVPLPAGLSLLFVAFGGLFGLRRVA